MTTRSRAAQSASLAVAVLTLVAGCSLGGSSNTKSSSAPAVAPSTPSRQSPVNAAALPTSPSPLPVVASADANSAQGTGDPDTVDTTDMTLQVNSAKRDSSGLVTLTWTVVNNSSHDLDQYSAFWDETDGYFGLSVSDVQIINQSQSVKYYPLIDTQKNCYCSRGSGADLLPAGSSQTFIDIFKPSPDTAKVDVNVKGFLPIKNVPVT